ncbi:hypothetical protein M9458_008982, partial [Cirrhinus mrigala]
DRPEGCVLSCFDPSTPQTISAVRYKVLPFGLSLSPRVFMKVVEAALVPLKEQGILILNYLHDWLILAQNLVLAHLSRLGLRVNWEKIKLSQTLSTAHLMQERALLVLNCLNAFKCRTAVPLKQFQRLLGHMAVCSSSYTTGAAPYETTSTLAPQPSPEEGVAVRHSPGQNDTGLPPNLHPLQESPWNRWLHHQLGGHIRRAARELAVRLALICLKGRLRGKHVLVRTDNTATVAYINRQGSLHSRHMSHLTHLLLLWSLKHLRSLSAIHIPGLHNPGWDAGVLGDLPQGAVDTITSTRAQSMRHAYALKWYLFVKTPEDFRSELFPSTHKVYVAAIVAHHDPIEGKLVGKHDLVI